MAKKKSEKPMQESGGARLKKLGKTPVQLGLKPEVLAIIDEARSFEPRASYILRVAVEVSQKIIAERKR